MAVKFQYNKTSLQGLEKNLKIRVRALPTIKSKESALRVEVKKAKSDVQLLDDKFEQLIKANEEMMVLYGEYDPSLLEVSDVLVEQQKIAGVKIPVFKGVDFDQQPFSLFNSPSWLPGGIVKIRELAAVALEREFYFHKVALLEYARKKTTQKVNLFEKVQIPGFEDAIRKIKRFLEDEENLSKAAQKIVKSRQEETEEPV
ncbi:V-type ATP synthase subunit D [Mangrovibacterium marinum]|uniref:V/A-type H+-transporting ATPase subunit D n=1 Tax=Mangrovibacterium marinum TaxID=1639118 RepID=A0A2T5C0V1_9BACT|nr:V-type ATP synthase subunit D [Mangrovibacterium marinum]PTN08208.1 V/A-type H+-transporting ATPase subunit D [Mangrovibacterium marinum]